MSVKFLVLVIFIFGTCAGQGTNLDVLINLIFNTTETNSTASPNGETTVTNPVPPVQVSTTTSAPRVDNTPRQSCGIGKECVPYFLCDNDSLVKDGTNIIDIRIGADCNYLDTCCSLEDEVTEPIISLPREAKGCGYRNVDGVGFKITGDKDNEAEFGEFPWMVAVLSEEHAVDVILNLYQCGGSLIAPTVVLTAAHCVQSKAINSLKVRAGEWDTQSKSEILPDQDRQVVDVIVHPQYNNGSLFNDVALLFVDSPFEWDENVRPVCLPPADINFDYSRCYATGWGKNEFGKEGKYQVILKKIDLPVMPRDQCQTNLRNTRLGRFFELHQSFICAGGERGKDTCKGDGGSPLACPIPGKPDQFYQAGIVAWGIGCGEVNIPGVYASIPYLRSWVDKQLASKRIDPSHFTP